eukprot:7406383-Pyramimonas_sp.AAC.1
MKYRSTTMTSLRSTLSAHDISDEISLVIHVYVSTMISNDTIVHLLTGGYDITARIPLTISCRSWRNNTSRSVSDGPPTDGCHHNCARGALRQGGGADEGRKT